MSGRITYSMDGLSEEMEELIDAINCRPIVVQTGLNVDGREFAKGTDVYKRQRGGGRKSGFFGR